MTSNKYAVIVAAGSGSRMKSALPKQFLSINNRPILYYTVRTFLEAYDDLIAIVILPKEYLDKTDELFEELPKERLLFVEGGETRFHSVRNGLRHVPANTVVFVHDGVRCMVSADLIKRCHDAALGNGNAIPTVHATDSIRLQYGDKNASVDRNQVHIVQTPQTFQSNIILKAFEKEYDPLFTDEASVVEADGITIHLVEGEHQNIKVTRPIDLMIVEQLMQKNVTF